MKIKLKKIKIFKSLVVEEKVDEFQVEKVKF